MAKSLDVLPADAADSLTTGGFVVLPSTSSPEDVARLQARPFGGPGV